MTNETQTLKKRTEFVPSNEDVRRLESSFYENQFKKILDSGQNAYDQNKIEFYAQKEFADEITKRSLKYDKAIWKSRYFTGIFSNADPNVQIALVLPRMQEGIEYNGKNHFLYSNRGSFKKYVAGRSKSGRLVFLAGLGEHSSIVDRYTNFTGEEFDRNLIKGGYVVESNRDSESIVEISALSTSEAFGTADHYKACDRLNKIFHSQKIPAKASLIFPDEYFGISFRKENPIVSQDLYNQEFKSNMSDNDLHYNGLIFNSEE